MGIRSTGMNPAAIAALGRGDLENFLTAATPGGIERQEAMGQASFVGTKHSLPRECPRAELQAMGFVFGADIDDLFVEVAFPEGWRKEATDHSMWSNLIDDKGRKRGSIFYKAAFYDRSAHMNLERRYRITCAYDSDPRFYFASDGASRNELFRSQAYGAKDYSAADVARAECEAYMDENFPDWASASAYWDAD